MKNPLLKRIPRELKHDFGKYLILFIFMVLFIGMISGFLVTDNSFLAVYDRGFTEQKIEDGHITFDKKAPTELLQELSETANVSLHPYFYFEEDLQNTEKTVRVYSTDREVNLLSLLSGTLPTKENEIALDRMFAQNNNISVGDTVLLKDTGLTVTGLIASPDYSCLYENNSDMMFDAANFCVGVMSEEGFSAFGSSRITYNYAWLYPQTVERTDVETAKELGDTFVENLTTVLTDYNLTQYQNGNALLQVEGFLPRYLNQAINFVGDDMGGDKIMFLLFDYILTVVLAFVFAITVNNTITTEAGVIGTLRASGFSKKELLSHYIVLPVLVTLLAALIGNVLGYTVFCNFFVELYYNSYCLAAYEALWNAEAFLLTTVIPLIIMFVINFAVILWKLRLSPLKFLRHDLSKSSGKRGLRLSEKLPFLSRFRIRIILQNLPNYFTLFFGILIGGILVVFGIMFEPLLETYKERILNDRICDYQYVLSAPVETQNSEAEKFALTSLKTTDTRFMEDTVSVFGVEENSRYLDAPVSAGKTIISNGIAEKFGLSIGDTLTLKDPYNRKQQYSFSIDDICTYNSGLAVFLIKEDYCKTFAQKPDYFNGYFSNAKLTDLDEASVATVITVSDLTKMSDQMTLSLGSIMGLFQWLGVIIFVLLMFLMSKQVIEKSSNSISMTKILGFSNREIGGLYLVATSIVVILSLLLSIPLLHFTLRKLFETVLYSRMTGYLPFLVSADCYVKMFLLGLGSYALIAVLQLAKIKRISKRDALKAVE